MREIMKMIGHGLSSPARSGRGARLGRLQPRAFDCLEARQLLAVVVEPIDVQEGDLFANRVATFAQGDVEGTLADIQVTVHWGDGTSSGAAVGELESGGFEAGARHQYAQSGRYPVKVVVSGSGSSQAIGSGIAVVTASPIVSEVGTVISPPLGRPFTEVVGSFWDPNPFEEPEDFSAFVNFGDGNSGRGTIVRNSRGGFDVVASHTYATMPPESQGDRYPITVEITERGAGTELTTINSQARLIVSPFIVSAIDISVGATVPEQEVVVGVIRGADPMARPEDFQVLVDLDRRQGVPGRVVEGRLRAVQPGEFEILASVVYPNPGTFPFRVQVTRIATSEVHTDEGNASVGVAPPGRITGGIDPVSNAISLDQNRTIINTPFPTFAGTARPLSVIFLYARRLDHKQETLLDRVVANAQGNWRTMVGPLPDGPFEVWAVESTPAEMPERVSIYGESRPLIIDTLPPAVLRLQSNPFARVIQVEYQNDGMLDRESLIDPNHYAIQLGSRSKALQRKPVSAAIESEDPGVVVVAVNFDRPMPRHSLFRISGVRDVAGNAINDLFRPTPVMPTPIRRPPTWGAWTGLRGQGPRPA